MALRKLQVPLPEETLQRAERLATERNTTVIRLLREALDGMLEAAEGYRQARNLHLEVLKEGFDLGTQGSIHWSRDSLHDRRVYDGVEARNPF